MLTGASSRAFIGLNRFCPTRSIARYSRPSRSFAPRTPPHFPNQLDAFHALLPALARALDVRDVFQHLSAIASRITHDEANVALLTDDGSQYRLYASTAPGDPKLLCRGDHCVLQDPIVPRLLDAAPGPERGLRSGVSAPVIIDDKTYRLGRALRVDSDTEQVIGDEEANRFLSGQDRGYRAPFVVPDEV